jgi:hypothetical protein
MGLVPWIKALDPLKRGKEFSPFILSSCIILTWSISIDHGSRRNENEGRSTYNYFFGSRNEESIRGLLQGLRPYS